MQDWILLLRGINVGGKNPLPMRELVRDLTTLGLDRVRTYIQSGNAVFRAAGKTSAALAEEISAAIGSRHGFRPQVLVLSADALRSAIGRNPFPGAEAEPTTVHLFFLASAPATPNTSALESARSPTENFNLDDQVFYLHAPDGIGRSKLAATAERHLGVTATARNWRTVTKLLELVDS